MSVTVTGLFADRKPAEEAAESLIALGIERESISIALRATRDLCKEKEEMAEIRAHPPGQETLGSAVSGGLLGGILGLAAGAVLPGALLVVGPLAGLLGGAALGATTGAIAGSLRELGLDEHDAHGYASSLEAGATLVVVHSDRLHAHRAAEALRNAGAYDVHTVRSRE